MDQCGLALLLCRKVTEAKTSSEVRAVKGSQISILHPLAAHWARNIRYGASFLELSLPQPGLQRTNKVSVPDSRHRP